MSLHEVKNTEEGSHKTKGQLISSSAISSVLVLSSSLVGALW